jgi:CheY-like chemotaxis protein
MTPAPEHPTDTAPRCVLVVEDNTAVRETLGRAITSFGLAYELVPGGPEALARLACGDYAAVLCDFNIPAMSGYELFRNCEQCNPELAQKFIFLTGSLAAGDTQQLLHSTGRPTLHKPCRLGELRAIISHVVDGTPYQAPD